MRGVDGCRNGKGRRKGKGDGYANVGTKGTMLGEGEE